MIKPITGNKLKQYQKWYEKNVYDLSLDIENCPKKLKRWLKKETIWHMDRANHAVIELMYAPSCLEYLCKEI